MATAGARTRLTRHRRAARALGRPLVGAALALVSLSSALGQPSTAPGDRSDDEGDASHYYVVSRPSALVWSDDASVRAAEGNFFVIKRGPDDFVGYLVSGPQGPRTRILRGPSVEKLQIQADAEAFDTGHVKGNAYCGRVAEPDQRAQYSDCGKWLRFVDKRQTGFVGLFHAETGCCYTRRQTYYSAGLAASSDGLHFSDALGYPLIPDVTPPRKDAGAGNAQISAVRVGATYYMYFAHQTESGTEAPVLARMPVDATDPAHVEKYQDGAFRPLSYKAGTYAAIAGKHGISPGYSDPTATYFLIGPKAEGLFLSAGPAPYDLHRIGAPLVAAEGRNMRRTVPLYVGRRPYNGFFNVNIRQHGDLVGYLYAQAYKTDIDGHAFASERLVDCAKADGTHEMRIAACQGEETPYKQLPFLIDARATTPDKSADYGLRPLYQCDDRRSGTHVVTGDTARCRSGSDQLLGFMPSEAAGAYYGNASIVGPQGSNHFDDSFYIFYNYTRPGDTRLLRNFVFNKVTRIATKEKRPPVQTMLATYTSADGDATWATTSLPDRTSAWTADLGYVSTAPVVDGLKLIDCRGDTPPMANRHAIRVDACPDGETAYQPIGYTFAKPTAFTQDGALAMCREPASGRVRYGRDLACDAGWQKTALGFTLR